MKFFWKIFFTTMVVSILSLAIAGYAIIHANFQNQFQSEIDMVYDSGDTVAYSLANEMEHTKKDLPAVYVEGKAEQVIRRVAGNLNIKNSSGPVEFGVVGPNGNVLYDSLKLHFSKNKLDDMNWNERGYIIRQQDQKKYVQAFRPVSLLDVTCYVETIRDVTEIFDNQKAQYRMLLQLMVGIFAAAGFLTFIMSHVLMRNIRSLSKVTQQIADGNYSERVKIRGEDEIAVLAQNFNQMSMQLEDKMEALHQEIENREMFIGAFSHELKTPLTSIIGYSDMLRTKELSGENQKICADYIYSEGRRLEGLSMRMLELTVVKNRQLHYVQTDIEQMIQEIRQMVFLQLKNEGIQIITEVEQALIWMEPEIMKTVFINLIDNARKAINGGGTIWIWGKKVIDGYQIVIRDDGQGMNAEELDRIIKPFYMVDKSRARSQGGAGLGLAICEEILALHGFEMKFESKVEVGTKVAVFMKGETDEKVEE